MAPSLPALIPRELEGMRKIRDELTRQWKESRLYEDQINWMKNTILPLKGLRIDRALYMGLGNISPYEQDSTKLLEDQDVEDLIEHWGVERRGVRGMTQLVAFECWLDILCTKFKIHYADVHFQESRLDENEAKFLSLLGYTVLIGPQAIEHVLSDPHAIKHSWNTAFLLCLDHLDLCSELLAAAEPGLVVMSPSWVQDHKPDFKLSPRDIGYYRRMRDFAKTRDTQRLWMNPGQRRDLNPKGHIERRMIWMINYEWYWKPNGPSDLPARRGKIQFKDESRDLRRTVFGGLLSKDGQLLDTNRETAEQLKDFRKSKGKVEGAKKVESSGSRREASTGGIQPKLAIGSSSPYSVTGLIPRASSLKADMPHSPKGMPLNRTQKVSFTDEPTVKPTVKPPEAGLKNYKVPYVEDEAGSRSGIIPDYPTVHRNGNRNEKGSEQSVRPGTAPKLFVGHIDPLIKAQFPSSNLPSNSPAARPTILNRPGGINRPTPPYVTSKLLPIQPDEVQEPSRSTSHIPTSRARIEPQSTPQTQTSARTGPSSLNVATTAAVPSPRLQPRPPPPRRPSDAHSMDRSDDSESSSDVGTEIDMFISSLQPRSSTGIDRRSHSDNEGDDEGRSYNRSSPLQPLPLPPSYLRSPPPSPIGRPRVPRNANSKQTTGFAPRRQVVDLSPYANSNLAVFLLLVTQAIWIWYFMSGGF